MRPQQEHNRSRLCVAKESFNGRGWGPLTPLRRAPIPSKKAECELALRRESKAIALGRLAASRLDSRLCLFLSFGCKFLCHGLLQLFSIHSIAFGGVHENIVAASCGSLIRRI